MLPDEKVKKVKTMKTMKLVEKEEKEEKIGKKGIRGIFDFHVLCVNYNSEFFYFISLVNSLFIINFAAFNLKGFVLIL